jgi:hypothetical protein
MYLALSGPTELALAGPSMVTVYPSWPHVAGPLPQLAPRDWPYLAPWSWPFTLAGPFEVSVPGPMELALYPSWPLGLRGR